MKPGPKPAPRLFLAHLLKVADMTVGIVQHGWDRFAAAPAQRFQGDLSEHVARVRAQALQFPSCPASQVAIA